MKLTLLSLLSLLAVGANAHCECSIQITEIVVVEVAVSSHTTVCLDRRERPGPQHWSPRPAQQQSGRGRNIDGSDLQRQRAIWLWRTDSGSFVW